MDKNNHIIAKNIGHTYVHSRQAVAALSNISLNIRKGEFVSIIGPNGSGKTTLLKLIGGLLKPTLGTVSLNGMNPSDYQKSKQIGFVFQDPALLPWRTVFDNVILPQKINRNNGSHNIKSPKYLIEAVGLTSFQNFYPHQLSGGMKQRVAFARSLSTNPEILLMDEPLASLDDMTRATLRYELLGIWQADGKTVILVTHSIPEAVIMSDRILVLSEGPGQLHGEISIDLPRPRFEALEHTDDFYSYSEQIKNLLSRGGNSA